MNPHDDASRPKGRPDAARPTPRPGAASPFGSAATGPAAPPTRAEIESWKEPRFVHGFTQADYQQFYGLNHWPNFPPPPRE